MPERRLVAADTLPIKQAASICYALAERAYPTGAPWRLATFEANLQLSTTTYMLLWSGRQPIGFLSYSTVLDETEITNVAIQPDFQRQGHAGWLLTTCLAKIPRPAQIFLEVRASNLPAQRLYQRCGFVQLTTRKNYYHNPDEDAWIMRKIID